MSSRYTRGLRTCTQGASRGEWRLSRWYVLEGSSCVCSSTERFACCLIVFFVLFFKGFVSLMFFVVVFCCGSLIVHNQIIGFISNRKEKRKYLINDALKTFYLRLYGVRHMVKDHSYSERGNPLPPHRLLLPITRKGSFISIIPQTG